MSSITGDVQSVKREIRLGESRIDFLVNDRILIEVKTLLHDLPCEGHPSCRARHGPLVSFDRLIRHFKDISKMVSKGSRAVLLLCYLYDAKPFEVPKPDRKSLRVHRSARAADSRGLEHWQLNLRVDKRGVEFLKCFKLDLF
jgi:sugar fermentation stimulation protein A